MARVWVKFDRVKHSSVANTNQTQWTGLTTGYGNEPGGEYYNDGIQIFCVDLRAKLQQYRGCTIDAILLDCWSRKQKHSGRHYWWLTPIMMDPGSIDPRNKPWSQIGRNVAISSINFSDQPKDGVPNYIRNLDLKQPIPVEQYIDRLLPFGCCGDLNSARSYGFCSVVGLSLYRQERGFPGWATDVMNAKGNAVPGWASQMISGNWLTNVQTGRNRLFNVYRGKVVFYGSNLVGNSRLDEIEQYFRRLGITTFYKRDPQAIFSATRRYIEQSDFLIYDPSSQGRVPHDTLTSWAFMVGCGYATIDEALQWARTGKLVA